VRAELVGDAVLRGAHRRARRALSVVQKGKLEEI
jgi:hypothetical protein